MQVPRLAPRRRPVHTAASVTAAVLVCGSLAACSGDDADGSSEPSGTTEPSSGPSSGPSTPAVPPKPARKAFGAPSLEDPYVGSFGNGGYDVVSYDLQLHWRPEQEQLDGTAVITARATQNLSRFNLDLVGLKVRRTTVEGRRAEVSRRKTELRVTPRSQIAEGTRFTTEIRYGGRPRESGVLAQDGLPSGWRTLEDSAFLWGEPISASTLFPVNDHPSDKARYRFRITAPSGQSVAANGVMTSKRRGGAETTWTFLQKQPQAPYLTTVLVGDFRELRGGYSKDGVPVRNYAPPDLADQARTLFAKQAEMIDVFSPLFGGYPFDVYGSALVDDDFPAALETQTLSVFSPTVASSGERVVVHELAHQWFGNSVSIERWGDIWLNEGFATYAEALWSEEEYPGFSYQDWIRSLVGSGEDLDKRVLDPRGDLFSAQVYLRGAMTLHALRHKVGDQDFFSILRTWHRRYAGANATTKDFEKLAAEVSGTRLGDFFDAWLRTEQLPPRLDGVPLR